MRIILAKNVNKDIDESIYDLFCMYAKKCGIQVNVANDLNNLEQIILSQGADCVAVFGGDGTMLVYSHLCTKFDLPILAINMGKIGFLSQLEINDLLNGLTLLAGGKYIVESRSMLKVSYNNFSVDALNEAVFCNIQRNGTVAIDVSVGTEFVDTFVGDGIILSTPTGSTAYSLSAGGPILYPDLDVTLLTPLCAHSFRNRPVVFSGMSNVKVSCKQPIECLIDGVLTDWKLDAGCSVWVSKSGRSAKFIKFKSAGFFSKLFKKLSSWSMGGSEVTK